VRLAIRAFMALFLLVSSVGATETGAGPRTRLELEEAGALTRVWVEVDGADGRARRHVLRETSDPIVVRDTGQSPAGQARFATWDEAGRRWSSHTRDAGETWSRPRPLNRELRLRDGGIAPDAPMPAVPAGYALPAAGRLFLVQLKTVSLPEWRAVIGAAGGEVLATMPHNAHIVRADAAALVSLAELEFVERIEPYHPWYRLDSELRAWLDGSGDSDHELRLRFVVFEWGPGGKQRIIESAEALGARVASYWSSGHVVELWVTRDQLSALVAHDDVMSVDRWTPPESDMDQVRQDSGADWVETNFGYCGQGVRGEVMDIGFQLDHPDFDCILTHGATSVASHGTSTYGIVFGNGARDGDGEAQATGHLPCAEQGIAANYNGFSDRFVHTQELKEPPFEASFQTNSWGSGLTTAYTSASHELDDIVWQLDIAILNSQSNDGTQYSRPEAWAKNVISVGGIRHYDTLDTSDDAWAGGASIGPAADGRIKPDINYWYDSIYTTTTGSGYTSSFGGTSAATPESAGVLGLMLQMWSENVWDTDPVGASVFERQPHFSTLKALLINNAQQYDFVGSGADLSRFKQGWGRPSAQVALERAAQSLVVDEEILLELNDSVTYDVEVLVGETALKVTMVYPDPPGTTSASLHRINDLDLTVTSPSFAVYHGNVGLEDGTESTTGGSPDGLNTVENVFVTNPEMGTWTVEVEAVEVNQDAYPATVDDDVTFALVVTGAAGRHGPDGRARFLRNFYGCGHQLTLQVLDGNVGASSVSLSVGSDTESTAETVMLSEVSPGSGKFTGELSSTSDAPTIGDGILSLSDGDVITLEYIDADDGAGGVNVSRQDTAAADCGAPVITQVQHTNVSDSTATITWTTDESSTSVVTYGEVFPPTLEAGVAGLPTAHAVILSGLQACTAYYYALSSTDLAGNTAVDDNGGAYFRFETLGNFGEGLQSCHEGRIDFEVDTVACSSTLPITLIDQGLNEDPLAAETWTVTLTSTTEPLGESILMTETGVNTSVFTASASTTGAAANPGDGVLQVADGDLLTVTYNDADDGTGTPGTTFDTADTDCSGPVYTQVTANNITDLGATIEWNLDEEATGYVEWGTTAALGNVVNSNTPATSHSVAVGPFTSCGRVYFRVVSTDAYGNFSTADAAGSPFEFNAYGVPGVVWEDGFETDIGWSLDGEWEIGGPQGLGTAPADPSGAFDGTGVLGHDLSGQGAYPGDYEPLSLESAISPVIDASGLSSGQLKFRRWLNVTNGSFAYIDVKDSGGSWVTVFQTSIPGLTDSSWTAQTFDVSAYADGNASFQIRFRERSHIASSHDAGWNVDALVLRDGSLPAVDACGGCAGAPSFAGVVSATDNEPCADSGLTVTWSAAPGWGTGSTGSYAVYRDTVPGFTPGPGNLMASGLTGSSWNDATAPNDATLYYVVRAENDETCSGGPANGGLVDANLVYAVATDATSQPAPDNVGNTLVVEPVNQAHVRLDWISAANAADYRVFRSSTPDATFAVVAQPTDSLYEDPGALADSLSWYYLVTAADACGNESSE